MSEDRIQRYQSLRDVTARVARASAELELARENHALHPRHAAELDELGDRLRALHVLLANEVERAWNAAEAEARRARRGTIMGRLRDAVSAETALPTLDLDANWQVLGSEGDRAAGEDTTGREGN